MQSQNSVFVALLICLFTTSALCQSALNTARRNNIFAFELFKNAYSDNKNVFLSPYSISSALSMVYAGANNETEEQMSKVLHFDLNKVNCNKGFSEINKSLLRFQKDSTTKLSIANALWIKGGNTIKSEFLETTKKYYDAVTYPLTDAKTINDWAEGNTHGKILKVVTDADLVNVELVLTNAIYFKGDWLSAFRDKDTRKDTFLTSGNKKVIADMMFSKKDVMYFEDGKNQVLELPYKGDSVTMLIVLPGSDMPISELVKTIDYKFFNYYNTNLTTRSVLIHLPKFTFTSSFELSNTLSKMGMPLAFDLAKADFSGIAQNLVIGKVIHKAYIDVNEKGSEAAAVTAVTMVLTSKIEDDKITFKANRPFMFFINDKKTGSILFMGCVNDPTKM